MAQYGLSLSLGLAAFGGAFTAGGAAGFGARGAAEAAEGAPEDESGAAVAGADGA